MGSAGIGLTPSTVSAAKKDRRPLPNVLAISNVHTLFDSRGAMNSMHVKRVLLRNDDPVGHLIHVAVLADEDVPRLCELHHPFEA